ncbi:calcium-binding protein [Herbaspirillum sp. YR522]|uniref:calcium-binding protein n=1 Tax=Herbaspirillum sp. YR522 TaxID=1144342 RepID=UPI00026FC45B|nr:calcium-binding protein [Herbaspirillum sp. YR522]EJN09580.1 hemolysin-type calcium-binding protein [Herbaspirillum sp. YR522]
MSNATPPQLLQPLLQAYRGDLLVRLSEGGPGWYVRDHVVSHYFDADDDPAEIAEMIAAINTDIVLRHHPEPDGPLWALGTTGNDVVVSDDHDVSVSVDDGKDVVITGAGDDYLSGDGGDDWLYGGAGDDNLLGGAGNDRLVGELGDDMLNGGSGDDRLFGGDGNDRLHGDGGNDRLNGGAGDDIYFFGKTDGADRIFNNDADGDDRVQFRNGIDPGQLWLRRLGSNLEVMLTETGDTLTLYHWFAGEQYRVDRFQLSSDGMAPNCSYLSSDKVEVLVAAMSALPPPQVGTTVLPPHYQVALNAVLAASWT